MSPMPQPLPPPELVIGQIDALQDELAALRRLLRAAQAAAQAADARRRRLGTENQPGEAKPCQ
jgi:hypothetical protein